MSQIRPDDSVAFLGPLGTYTHEAAGHWFSAEAQWLPQSSIQDVFAAVENGEAQWGVVPVENSSEGSVLATLDCFSESSLLISAELMLRIHHCFLVPQGTNVEKLEKIVSHQQSLGQCRDWLQQHFPAVEKVSVSSNAEAARLSAGSQAIAAIAGKAAAEIYGLQVFEAGIEDTHDNTTRFLLVGKKSSTHSTGKDKTSVMISVHNEPGALFQALEPFHRHGINLIKLESRPSRKAAWSYSFYVDLEGHVEDAPIIKAFDELRTMTAGIKVLGSYPGGAPE